MTPKVLKAKLRVDRPTAKDKGLEAGMAAELSKEDFYGEKKKAADLQARMNREAKEAIGKRKVEELTKKMRQAPKGVIFRSVTIQKKP